MSRNQKADYWRKYYAEHRYERLATTRKSRERKRIQAQQAYRVDPTKVLERAARARHGDSIAEDFAAMWKAQDGKCYLCGDVLDSTSNRKVHVDHDHACCGRGRSCKFCRRGLACGNCNALIGHAREDPERLRLIADNLEAMLVVSRERMALKPTQETLL